MNYTYKKISAALLAAGMIVIPSCSKKEPDNTTASSAVQTTTAASAGTETENPASSETSLAPVIADNEQLEIIFKNKAVWYEANEPERLYSITDLDMNGLYEITSSYKDTFFMYEVKADKSGVEMIDNDSDYSCVSMDKEYALRMNKNGAYEFISREFDDLGASTGPSYVYYWRLSYSDRKLTGDLVATEIHEEDGRIWYGDDEFHMTPEEFKNVTETSLPKITCKMTINWADGKTIAGMNDAKSLEAICFKLTK
ncbi:MAG: hypothetical protein K6E60_05525 [Saccharofermentans sp.]|nr:hypothetical protein [Saccharofermentans sp.]